MMRRVIARGWILGLDGTGDLITFASDIGRSYVTPE